jgi:hypothetical protein
MSPEDKLANINNMKIVEKVHLKDAFKPMDIHFDLVNVSSNFEIVLKQQDMQPYKSLQQDKHLVVYKHRNDEFITVDVTVENRASYFIF